MAKKMTIPVVERTTVKLSTLVGADYNPRKISAKARKGLQSSLEKFGLVQEIVVNKRNNTIVGGHQRVDVLRVAGVEDVAVCFVDLDDAEEKALNVTLNNGEITGDFTDGLAAILESLKTELPEFEDLNLESLLEGDNEHKYSTEVRIPIYEPTKNKPKTSELLDETKTSELLRSIEESSTSPEMKRFLRVAAQRHTKFNYRRIADAYAHSDAETQRLFEQSALVIVDINKAIESGLVSLTAQAFAFADQEMEQQDES